MKKFNFDEIKKFISRTSKETSIYVGCDSKQNGDLTVFVSVIVIHIDSNKGGKIFYEVNKIKRIKSLRERLLKEVDFAIMTALNIIDVVGERPLEIHLDINPDKRYKSSIIVKEAISYVLAQGLQPKLKPESFAAYCVADYLTKN
jgi:hypothetical protein